MHNLKWIKSYRTVLLDTPDGDLDKGQFFTYGGDYFIRIHPKNNDSWIPVEQSETKGLIEVFILDEAGAYYDEFELPEGRKYRVKSDRETYEKLGLLNLRASKEVSDEEIQEIIKDDSKWQ